MFFVNCKPFDDLLDAIKYCKNRPTTTLTDSKGIILMKHEPVSLRTLQEISLAKAIYELQSSEQTELN